MVVDFIIISKSSQVKMIWPLSVKFLSPMVFRDLDRDCFGLSDIAMTEIVFASLNPFNPRLGKPDFSVVKHD